MTVFERYAAELRGILRASGYFDPGSRAFLLVNALESSGRSFEVQAASTTGAVEGLERIARGDVPGSGDFADCVQEYARDLLAGRSTHTKEATG